MSADRVAVVISTKAALAACPHGQGGPGRGAFLSRGRACEPPPSLPLKFGSDGGLWPCLWWRCHGPQRPCRALGRLSAASPNPSASSAAYGVRLPAAEAPALPMALPAMGGTQGPLSGAACTARVVLNALPRLALKGPMLSLRLAPGSPN